MSIAAAYASLARMLDYPVDKAELQAAHGVASAYLQEQRLDGDIAAFADFVTAAPLAKLQEEYVAAFDFNPATAPYLGHHLFGDNQKKGGYMIRLKQEFGRCGFAPAGNELPDHLPVVLGFLAYLAREKPDRVRQAFITDSVLPGVERLSAAFAARQDLPWKPVVEASRRLCAADARGRQPC